MVKDATAGYADEEMHAALDVNIPNYASAIVTTNVIVDSISSLVDTQMLDPYRPKFQYRRRDEL